MRRALTGTFLTLLILAPFATRAEAAEVFAHSVAELTQSNVIEPGDGNDTAPGELSVKAEFHSGPDRTLISYPALEGVILLGTPELPGFATASRLWEDPPWPSHRRAHRLAWLQIFLC